MTTIPQYSWVMMFRNALVVTRREVRDSLRDWRIVVPIIGLTFFFPFLAQGMAAGIRNFLAQYGAEFVGEQFIPFMLMIVGFFPISISLVIALETFVGEKERRSLEPLLSTPLTNTELYIGKALAAMIPPLIASFGGMSFYLLTLTWTGTGWEMSTLVIVQIFVLTIVQALVMVTGAVVVSSQATSTRSANLLASFIIIPMTLVINAEAIIIFFAPDAQSPYGISALWVISFGMVIAAMLLLRVGNSIFNREELLGRMIDNLNLWGALRAIWQAILSVNDDGQRAKNIIDWYRRGMPYAMSQIHKELVITVLVFIVYGGVGIWVGTLPQYQIPLEATGLSTANLPVLDSATTAGALPASWIVTNNLRVLVVGLLLSIISFGVMAYIVVPPVFIVLGYLASQLIPAGLGDVLAAAILPHGVLEISMVTLATAAMFRVGAVITRPQRGETVGQAWIKALGNALKIGIGIVLPGLLIAAWIESTITIDIVTQVLANR